MASFTPDVPSVNPTNYMSNQYTQGTDKAQLQPLSTVPDLNTKVVTPDYAANKALGKGIGEAGDVVGQAIKLTDSVIQSKFSDDLRTGINEIRDSFGVAQGADAAAALPSPTDTKGLSLTADDAQKDVPVAVNRLGAKIEGLHEAYRQGVFDDSAYFGKLEAYIKQVKQQYPGYEDQIDDKVRTITGTTPANALRSSLLQNVKDLDAKTRAAADKQATLEHQDSAYIHTIWPNYEAMKANGTAPSWAEVTQQVGQLKSREWAMSAKAAELAADKGNRDQQAKRAEDYGIRGLTDIAGHLVLGATNSMGLKSPQDFQKLFDDINAGRRQPLTPDEKQQVTGAFAALKQQYAIQAEKFLNEPLAKAGPGSTMTLTSKLADPEARKRIVAQGGQSLTDLEDGLFNEKYGIASATANWNKATMEAAEGDFLRRAPVAAAVAAGRKFYGDQGNMMLTLTNGPLKSAMLEGYRQYNQGKIATGDGSLKDTFDVFSDNQQKDPDLWRAAVNDSVHTIMNKDKVADPQAAVNAAKHLYGPGNSELMDAYKSQPGSQIWLFNNLVSPTMVHEMKKMPKESQTDFLNFAREGFQSVYATQAMSVNQSTKAWQAQGNLTLRYDPQSGNFNYETSRGLFYPKAPDATMRSANASLVPLNSAINSMKEVWKMEGKDPTSELYTLLPRVGITPDTPVFKAIVANIEKETKKPAAAPRNSNRYEE